MRNLALHWQILIGMVLGILFGLGMTFVDGGSTFVGDWIKPLGTIFVKLLKLIAVPLIIASLIKGISDLKDISKFKNIGLRTIVIYVGTTVIAITIGLILVNVVQPGNGISEETITKLTETYANSGSVQAKIAEASKQKASGPLQFLVDMVPDNALKAMGNNKSMLQVIFFTIFLGISMLLVGEKKSKPLKKFFDSLNEVVLKMVDLIMLSAPYAVFALLANVVVSSNDPDLLLALLKYALTVIGGLLLMVAFYMVLVSVFTKKNPLWFLKQISPAQLLAFSTSSSAATLPVTMERVEEHVGVDKEVSSFVLPVGATINMDGTSLYQAVAAVFIAQALSFDLSFGDQLTIILTALLASIGSAAVPGAGMVMLVIVLEAVGFPADKLAIGLALIFAVDRPLDMCRTVINVTGDATVASLVAKSVGKLGKPNPKNWDDNYDEVK
ncbi:MULTISPECIES: dicarboxylate/amino acid:cation symporter [unclassified Tenacibaculum]|uniref:dicarboxylate/amino acid:cation symporter n=1 Tax=unclassified Tenacibaculum TaxID=2635139 RepID=UPI001F3341CC|nr:MULTISPECIES: dicarboxylate/amino acid:cation symporter [unclassified Tenacibaculum]MCF2873913.1 dicarboxylate/amino acid:cation symporter [Tenacibaculum sp. Cn5-1]MCF2936723.1 dicarboxylate/amino acid:cation symporter [Tenacibaculum sp. Cn5-34]MCG7512947.1 dicarboxylate/amino acid:cation symporter [Tenacibaculum sp. Cn5-46]